MARTVGVLGGMGPDGRDAVTPLTYVMIDVFDTLNLTHPAVYTRISKANPREYVERCVAYLLDGGNRAQILADEPIASADVSVLVTGENGTALTSFG